MRQWGGLLQGVIVGTLWRSHKADQSRGNHPIATARHPDLFLPMQLPSIALTAPAEVFEPRGFDDEG